MTPGVAPDASQRAAVLTALHGLYCPAQLADVSAYVSVFADEVSPLPDSEAIVAAEAITWRSGPPYPNWICPALTHENGAPNQDHLTRSDWRLENRLLTDGGGTTRHVWLVRVFCDQYMIARENGIRDVTPLVARLRYHGRLAASSLPTELISRVTDQTRTVDGDVIDELREAAEDSHASLAAEDLPVRRRLARRLEGLDDYRRLFGNTVPG